MELILNTFGVSLNRDNEGFVINTSEGKQRIPAVGIDSIQISRGAQITSDAVMLAIEHEIEVMFMDKTGKPIGRIWSPKYGSISTIRKGQLNFIYSHNAVDWIKEVLLKKIENQQALMLLFNNDGYPKTDTEKNIAREGQASRIYFSTINAFLPEQFRFNIRSQHPALDITNAFLNYGYGILYGRIEGALIKAGVDPYIGVLHRDDYNRPVLVYDIIEMYRIWVDYVVYTLLAQNVITEEFYSVREDGSYWLEALGRRVLIQSLNDYMDEVITVKGVTRSRLTILSLYAQSLAQKFKEEM